MDKAQIAELVEIYVETKNWGALALLISLYKGGYTHHRERGVPLYRFPEEVEARWGEALDLPTPWQCGRRIPRRPGADDI